MSAVDFLCFLRKSMIAEADRVLCHLVMFLTVLVFHCIYKMKYSCFQDSSVIHDWSVYWVIS